MFPTQQIGISVPNTETTIFFKKAIKWNFIGSCLYEFIKVFHNFYLLGNMTSYTYGQTGFILSSIYLAVRIVDLGNAYSTVPMLHDIQRSKAVCKELITKFFLLPQLPVIFFGTMLLIWRVCPEISWLLISSIFILETYRLFLRYLLHAQFKNANVVVVELGSFSLFLGCIWIPYLFGRTLTPSSILLAHLADSSVATVFLGLITAIQYEKLPTTSKDDSLPSARRIIISKIFTYLNRLSREITSSNVLTPLYASLFGYEKVSIFYFLGIATTAYQMIIKNTITYSGNALLAKLRHAPKEEKSLAFNLITEKLLLMLALPLIVFLMFYYDAAKIIDHSLLLILIGFLVLMSIDLVLHVYEQYYLVQESAPKFFIFKLTESAACMAVFYFGSTWSMTQAFASFIVIKFFITLCTAIHAYAKWGLFIIWRKVITCIVITTIVSFVIKFFLKNMAIL
jgi:hypothetical protein